jgi:hypothetical protein
MTNQIFWLGMRSPSVYQTWVVPPSDTRSMPVQ